MQFVKAHIFGFGNWIDETIDLSNRDFICLYGENEAGKSTLQAFLLFMLFGFPPKKRAFYQPKASSRMGGRLTVKDSDHQLYTIERMHHVRNGAAVCEMENGEIYQEDWLKAQLNGMTQATYESIFSFSALDLTEIRNMKAEDLGDVLLGVGLTGSSGIQRIEKKLENEMGEWFKPTGKNPVINKQLRHLDDLKKNISELKETEETYRDKKQSLDASVISFRELKEHVKTFHDKRQMLERQVEALPLLRDYDACLRDLEAFPEEIRFPDNGTERFERLADQLLPLRGEYAALEKTKTQYKNILSQLKAEKCSEEHLQTVRYLLEQQNIRSDLHRQIKRQSDQIEQLHHQIEAELKSLSLDLGQEELVHIELPFGTEKRWQSLKERHMELDSEEQNLQEQHLILLREQEVLEQDQEKLTRQLLDEKEVRKLKALIDEDDAHNTAETLLQQTNKQQDQWQQMKQKRLKRLSITLWSALTIGAAVAFAGLFMTNTVMLFTAGLIWVFGIGQYIFGNRSLNDMSEMFSTNNGHDGRTALSEAERAQFEADLTRHNEAQDALKDLKAAEKTNHLEWLKWDERKNTFDIQKSQQSQAEAVEKQTYPFLGQVDITYWPELYLTLRHMLSRFEEKTILIEERTATEQKSYELHSQASAFYKEKGWPFSKEKTNVAAELSAYLDEQRNIENRIDSYIVSIEDHQTALDALKEKMQTYENEQAQLFRQAGVSEEEDFWEKASKFESKQQLKHHLKSITDQLSNRFSKEEQHYLYTEASRDEKKWQQEFEVLQVQQEGLEERLEQERSNQSQLYAELKQMESAETLSQRQHQFNSEQEELRRQAERWAVLATAKGVLNDAKRTFREKYMDKIMRQTTLYFKTLTDGRYSNVFAPEKGELFRVEQQDGMRFNVTELSQGTLDQLYVSLRLAIGSVISDAHNFPYMIDDAFVHFDAVRTRQVLGLLQKISSQQQIILFTCKKEIVQTVKKEKTVYLNESVRIANNLVIE
ncbi:uncharacterized protein JNUCC1_00407 [Lentibacillus sp. JNUCC-1]|uniref:ATP-binding protein n=1 Tax=Lentibacillus sp. JNUCC-1 TaxID=2654513 RepID=UPI0012E7CE6D|nr:AAA family ATPase [Lentibacillus sp. JNUCC-1]MUV36604.1 uncharacterized protein [Lentibacillus sp. JNUCC-1]